MKKLIYAVVISTGLVGSVAAMAAPTKGACGERMKSVHSMRALNQQLNLTPEQQTEIRAIYREFRSENPRQQMRAQGREARPEVSDPQYAEKLAEFARQRAAMTEQRIVQHGEIQARIHQILTEEQRATLQTLREERQQNWREHKGRKDGMRRGA